MRLIQISIVLCAVVACYGEVFNDAKHCPSFGTGSPCHCTETEIECHNRNLSSVPIFHHTDWVFKRLDLANNEISSLPSRIFENVNVTEIILRSNNISYIDDEAFSGLKNQLQTLNLRDNKLTGLPEVLGKLTKLHALDVSYNPIRHMNYTDNVMRELGDFMYEFSFGDPGLQEWPQSVHHLAALRVLKFYEGQMDRIPITAFAGFEWPLRKLWMQRTRLIAVPIALQDLHSVQELHFDDNIYVEDAGILIPAFAGLTNSLDTMSLENDGLTTFPLVLLTLQSLHNLSLARNNLQFVSDQAVGNVGSNLTTLNLQECNLDRIPGALSKLPGLINLDFSYNKITTIEKNDLQHMGKLRSLNVSHNPLQYISKSTFYDLTHLVELVLQNTSLYLVPEAMRNIPTLQTLHLEQPFPLIECNCDLDWLYCYSKSHANNFTIFGECFTIEMHIQEYAMQRIPAVCPVTC